MTASTSSFSPSNPPKPASVGTPVLRKRANYRKAFAKFDPVKVARFNAAKIEQMLQDPGLIRNRRKISAAVENARHFLAIQDEFGSFSAYIWRFVDGESIVNEFRTLADLPATSRESDALSKDLKSRGFKFIGSTVIYAHMQATGMINDHVPRLLPPQSDSRRRLGTPTVSILNNAPNAAA